MNRKELEDRLFRGAEAGTFSHAYILEGEKDGPKGEIAWAFAKRVCREAVVHVRADGLSVKDEDILELQNRLARKPFAGDTNAAIVENADTMTLRAQNRLLKTLEEPAGHSVILLLSENVENLLPTILSRCILYRLDGEKTGEKDPYQMEETALDIGVMLLEKRGFYQINAALTQALADRDHAYAFLDALEEWYRNMLLLSLPETEDLAEDGARNRLERLVRMKN